MTPPASLLSWLDGRVEGVPPSMVTRVRAAVAEVSQYESVSSGFWEAAHRLMATLGETNDDPHAVLTADALITYACEARSLEDPTALSDLR